jgi:Cu+-exporting ATPase
VLLTGDNTAAAHAVAGQVGIDEVIAEVMPSDKVDVIQRLQGEGKIVAMVGDGVNDAAALAQADLGLAMGTGTDVAIEASDITLVRGDLRAAADAIRLARSTLRTIRGNLFWAFAYNIAALPLAAAGLLNPMLAGAAMAFSKHEKLVLPVPGRRFGWVEDRVASRWAAAHRGRADSRARPRAVGRAGRGRGPASTPSITTSTPLVSLHGHRGPDRMAPRL